MKALLKVTGRDYQRDGEFYTFTYSCHVRAHIVSQKVNALPNWTADQHGRQVTARRVK